MANKCDEATDSLQKQTDKSKNKNKKTPHVKQNRRTTEFQNSEDVSLSQQIEIQRLKLNNRNIKNSMRKVLRVTPEVRIINTSLNTVHEKAIKRTKRTKLPKREAGSWSDGFT